jgi:hypothetical protein
MSNNLAIRQTTEVGIDQWKVMHEQSTMLVKTGFLPTSVNTPEKAMAIILTGRELGIGTMQALRSINVIQGRPTVSAELMLALCYQRVPGFKCDVVSSSESCTVKMRRGNGDTYDGTFTSDDAKKAGLAEKDIWKKYGAAMLRARAISAGCRVIAPDAIMGLYTPEEMGAEVNEDGEVLSYPAVDAEYSEEQPTCYCGKTIQAATLGNKHYTGSDLAALSLEKYGNAMCIDCIKSYVAKPKPEPEQEEQQAGVINSATNKKIHAMVNDAFGKDSKQAYIDLKVKVLGDNFETPSMTLEQGDKIITALQELIEAKEFAE